jgi:predicted DNA repair protein MutK
MAGTSLLALIDDIATLLDDVSVMTKVAAKKTAGVLGDDLALNAEQVSGVKANRELPVVWAVAKGSALNKLILVPAALLISAFLPWLITPLLMIGGAFLCYEGCEKLVHKFFHKEEQEHEHRETLKAVADPAVDLVAFEKQKIKGAIRTDFILSAEIIVISLGAVQSATFGVQVAAICTIAVLMTIGVYGLVAGIVKLDDAGLYLAKTDPQASGAGARIALGKGILFLAPWLMKTLSVVGTAAMFLVGGGILVHGIPGSHDWVHHLQEMVSAVSWLVPLLVNLIGGLVAGAMVLAVVTMVGRLRSASEGS